MSITIRRSSERGLTKQAWLESHHTFSFDTYNDPRYRHFHHLRVINEDIIAPASGFAEHSHRDMEILTFVIQGTLEHRDSAGNHTAIQPRQIQAMSAGRGIRHSEYNPSATEPVHLLQIWIYPNEDGIEPGYQQSSFEDTPGEWKILASCRQGEGLIRIHQDMRVLWAKIENGQQLSYLPKKSACWAQLIQGKGHLNQQTLFAGDGVAIERENKLLFQSEGPSTEILLFDMHRISAIG